MSLLRNALKVGAKVVQTKLGEAVENPSFNAQDRQQQLNEEVEDNQRLPVTAAQTKNRSARIQPPKIVTTR